MFRVAIPTVDTSSPFTLYCIQVEDRRPFAINKPMWTIKRRFKQFWALRESLRYNFSVVDTLYFPPKMVFGKRDPTVIEKRRIVLESFLQSLLHDDAIAHTKDILAFLKTEPIPMVVSEKFASIVGSARTYAENTGMDAMPGFSGCYFAISHMIPLRVCLESSYLHHSLQQEHHQQDSAHTVFAADADDDANLLTPGRAISLTSYMLLIAEHKESTFRVVNSDEIWHFYFGQSANLMIILHDGGLRKLPVGEDSRQVHIPNGSYLSIQRTQKGRGHTLIGITSVGRSGTEPPWEWAERDELMSLFPEHSDIVRSVEKRRRSSSIQQDDGALVTAATTAGSAALHRARSSV